MIKRIFSNWLVVAIITVVVVVCLCWICGIGFHMNAGQGGLDIGFTHSK